MKSLSLLLAAVAIVLSFPACATTAKQACCATKKDDCCASGKTCPPSKCAAHGSKKKSS